MLPLGDGEITIRPLQPGDVAHLIAGRDGEWERWLGPGTNDPQPTAVITVGGEVVGWVDYDHPDWLGPDEVNVGYNVFPGHRGHGYATRAVLLLLQHLATDTDARMATLSIDADNARSLQVAQLAGFTDHGLRGSSRFFKRPVSRPA
jgi:RimJ/RimL family protein N-acetyltransferase